MPRYVKSLDLVQFDVADRVARITLNRPDKRNALSDQLLTELHDALLEADALAGVNVILLRGAGKDFCAGYDLADVYASRDGDTDGNDAGYRSYAGTFDDDSWSIEQIQRKLSIIFDIHKPVLAAIQGNCLAGGTDLALLCDIVLAAEDARIGFPAARANGTAPNHMWFYHVGPQWAKRLLMSGDCVSGLNAARIGLVLDAVPSAELNEAAEELAARLSNVDAELLSAHKRTVNLALELGGARTLQRLSAEMDARAHLSQGPRRRQFKADISAHGIGEAVRNRDAPFGTGTVRIRWIEK